MWKNKKGTAREEEKTGTGIGFLRDARKENQPS